MNDYSSNEIDDDVSPTPAEVKKSADVTPEPPIEVGAEPDAAREANLHFDSLNGRLTASKPVSLQAFEERGLEMRIGTPLTDFDQYEADKEGERIRQRLMDAQSADSLLDAVATLTESQGDPIDSEALDFARAKYGKADYTDLHPSPDLSNDVDVDVNSTPAESRPVVVDVPTQPSVTVDMPPVEAPPAAAMNSTPAPAGNGSP